MGSSVKGELRRVGQDLLKRLSTLSVWLLLGHLDRAECIEHIHTRGFGDSHNSNVCVIRARRFARIGI